MGVLNVRIDDHVHGKLKVMADEEGVTLSEYVRDLVLAAVVKVAEPHGDEPAPESFRTVDRLTLSLLHRILARVLPEDADGDDGDLEYQLNRAQVIESGYTGEYWQEVAGLETELSVRDCRLVSDILEMFRIITFSIQKLQRDDVEVDTDLQSSLKFEGFDHNITLEGHMSRYVRYQLEHDRWQELKEHPGGKGTGNSHMPTLDVYQRMLAEYRRIVQARTRGGGRYDWALSVSDLHQIAAAQVHPSHRRSGQ